MYDKYTIDNQDYNRKDSNTLFYYYVPNNSIKIDPLFIPPSIDKDKNFIFLNTNYTDHYYLLNKHNPNIDHTAELLLTENTLDNGNFDIAFISNGENNAKENYDWLMSFDLPNRIYHIKDINGRNATYKAAAATSNTRYFFAVFGKLSVRKGFDFSFNVEPFDKRHYVFRSINSVNGLCYGHQGMILYNKEKVLENAGNQIDFTMAQLYREVPIISGLAKFNYSALSTWRTAFRECLKLCMFTDDPVAKVRLEQWQAGYGAFSEYSVKGAKDAISFYNENKDRHKELLKSYDWDWLDNYFKRIKL